MTAQPPLDGSVIMHVVFVLWAVVVAALLVPSLPILSAAPRVEMLPNHVDLAPPDPRQRVDLRPPQP